MHLLEKKLKVKIKSVRQKQLEVWLCSCPSGLLKYIHKGKILPDVSNYSGTLSGLGAISDQSISL
jgi:hypothetical protein